MRRTLDAFPHLWMSYQKVCCDAAMYVTSSLVHTLWPLSPPCSIYENNAHMKNLCSSLTFQKVPPQQGSQKIFCNFPCVCFSGRCQAQLKCCWSYRYNCRQRGMKQHEGVKLFLLEFCTVVFNKQGKLQLKKSLFSANRVNEDKTFPEKVTIFCKSKVRPKCISFVCFICLFLWDPSWKYYTKVFIEHNTNSWHPSCISWTCNH